MSLRAPKKRAELFLLKKDDPYVKINSTGGDIMTKILVVEDDFFLRDGLSELLTKEGYEPVTAQNAAEAQARLTWDK